MVLFLGLLNFIKFNNLIIELDYTVLRYLKKKMRKNLYTKE